MTFLFLYMWGFVCFRAEKLEAVSRRWRASNKKTKHSKLKCVDCPRSSSRLVHFDTDVPQRAAELR